MAPGTILRSCAFIRMAVTGVTEGLLSPFGPCETSLCPPKLMSAHGAAKRSSFEDLISAGSIYHYG